jgi:hypothetical protein
MPSAPSGQISRHAQNWPFEIRAGVRLDSGYQPERPMPRNRPVSFAKPNRWQFLVRAALIPLARENDFDMLRTLSRE